MSNHERRMFSPDHYPAASRDGPGSALLAGSLAPAQGHHRQYLQQPPPHIPHPYSTPASQYPASYPIDRMSAVSAAPQYAHSMAPANPGHGSGYLDPFGSMPVPTEVMGMDLDLGAMDLSILSQQEHRDYRLIEGRKSQPVEDTLRSSDPDGGKGRGRRKRAQSDESETDPNAGRGGRKQRGRPRLDTKDENAADRRRTQIRLAQRAYRLRKETTISSLRTRVSELENAIEGMQSTFLELQGCALEMACQQSSKEREQYGATLTDLSKRFLALAKGALGASEGNDSVGEEEGPEVSSAKGPGTGGERRRSKDDDSPTGGMSDPGSTVGPYGGYQLSYDRASSQGRGAFQYSDSRSGPSPRDSLQSFETSNFMRQDGFSSGSLTSSLPSIPQELDTFAYSYYETSFSRRLHRAGLERAFQLLTCPNADQDEVSRTFAYTFCYATREDLIRSIAKALQFGNDDRLEAQGDGELDSPQRRAFDCQDQLIAYQTPKKAAAERDTSSDKIRVEAYKKMVDMGIVQKFLRPDDVEKILVEKGILTTTTSPKSSQENSRGLSPARMDVESANVGHHSPASTVSSVSDVQEARTPEELALSPVFERVTSPVHIHDDLDASFLFGAGHTEPAHAEEMGVKTSGKILQGVKRYVDLDILIKELLERGVCLGRYPGFKRADVDNAIAAASQVAF